MMSTEQFRYAFYGILTVLLTLVGPNFFYSNEISLKLTKKIVIYACFIQII